MFTMGEALATNARRYRDKTALIFGDLRLSYGDLDRRVNQTAHVLQGLGVGKGDHVALMLPNSIAMAECYFACARLGAVAVPLNLRLAPPELVYVLEHSDSRCLVADGQLLEEARSRGMPLPKGIRTVLRVGDGPDLFPEYGALQASAPDEDPGVAVEDEDPWVLVYTSGTTGRPKGAIRSHRSNLMIALLLATEVGVHADDTGLAILPMFHVNSLWVVSLSLAIGATLAIYPQRIIHPQHIIAELNRHQVSYAMFVPTLLTYLTEAVAGGQLDPAHLRVILSSSSPLAPALRDRVLASFPRARLYDIYGATELGAVTIMRHGPGRVTGSIGLPCLAQDVRLLDEAGQEVPPGVVGELYCHGPTLMDRYYKDPEATQMAFRGRHLSVGDLAYRDEAGYLFLVDRKSDMIITSGENVYPTEVENALLTHPAVSMAAVVGLPDPRRGEAVVAVVTLREGKEATPRELLAHLQPLLADYKRPRQVYIWQELPIGATGKVLRREVRRLLREGLGAETP